MQLILSTAMTATHAVINSFKFAYPLMLQQETLHICKLYKSSSEWVTLNVRVSHSLHVVAGSDRCM